MNHTNILARLDYVKVVSAWVWPERTIRINNMLCDLTRLAAVNSQRFQSCRIKAVDIPRRVLLNSVSSHKFVREKDRYLIYVKLGTLNGTY